MALPTGPTGPAGPTGIYGYQGPIGPRGVRGLIGPSGWSGYTYAQVFANVDGSLSGGSSNSAVYRVATGSGNSPPLSNSLSTTIDGLRVYNNTSFSGSNVFYVPAGGYFIQAMSPILDNGNDSNNNAVETALALSRCASPTGGSEVDIARGVNARQNANAYLSGMFYFSTPTYVALRQYGGTNGALFSPVVGGYGGDASLNNVMLSFVKI